MVERKAKLSKDKSKGKFGLPIISWYKSSLLRCLQKVHEHARKQYFYFMQRAFICALKPQKGLLWSVLVCCPPAEPSSVSTVSLGQRLPFPAFPLRASLPPLAPTLGPVQAAAPPADYHSDSAESLEEIPVALAKLGSSSSAATARDASTSSHRVNPAFPLPSPLPRTKRKTSSSRATKSTSQLRFEMASTHTPTVFVRKASGRVHEPREEGLSLGRRQASSRPGSRPGSRPASRASQGSGVASWMEL